MKRLILREISKNQSYSSHDGKTLMVREPGFADFWVLRQNGEFVAVSQYRNELEEKHNLKLIEMEEDW